MQRKSHLLFIHLLHQQTHGIHHHTRVRSLNRDNNVRKLLVHRYPEELHHTFRHTGRRIAVARHDSVGQTAMVNAQADSRLMLLANTEQCREPFAQTLQFSRIFFIRIVDMLEFACRVDVIPRIDAHLFHNFRSLISHACLKMHICHQRQRVAYLRLQLLVNQPQALHFAQSLRGEPKQLCTGFATAQGLCYTTLNVVG